MNMLNPFVCGTFNPEDDEPCLASSGSSSPLKFKRRDRRNNNPYSTRGLDKFSELLADLDEKRQKIYSQMSPHDISIVRFVHSKTDDFVPIVVKVKNKDQKHKSQELRGVKGRSLSPTLKSTDKSATESTATVAERKQTKLESDKKVAKKRISWNMKNLDTGKPYFYLSLAIILILVLLSLFGRTFATLCTCILWYVIPTLKDSSSNPRKSSMKKKDYVRALSEMKMEVTNERTKKKEYVRWWSEKKMEVSNEGVKKKDYVRGWSEKKMATEELLSPRSGDSEPFKNKIQGKHAHKKSW